jgi:cytochrome c oxidase cbb3-type subunit 3
MADKRVTDQSFDYDYDGIQEYDNPLPRWWLYLFYGAIVYAIVYIPYYHFGPGELPREKYAASMEEWNELHPPVPLPDEDELKAMESDEELAKGKEVFMIRCVACHAVDGGGSVGPNLTDNYTLTGYSRAAIVRTIHDGTQPDAAKGITGGMIAWGNQLSREEIYAVGLYVYSLRGTTPANPKAPQGEEIDDNDQLASK